MKKGLFKSAMTFVVIALLSSCAMHQGYMANSAALTSNNFSYVMKNIRGNAAATYIFGIGGLSKNAIVDCAKRDLLKQNPLKNNQALVNLTVSWKNSFFYPIYFRNKCTVTADIVEFK